MLDKICEYCNVTFTLPNLHKKNLNRRFCGPVCSRRWSANNRSETWKRKASLAKQGENNPMFNISQTNPNSLANLNRKGMTGKTQTAESNRKRSTALMGREVKSESIKKMIQTKIDKGIFWKPDDPEYIEFKKYRRKVYYWTSKNDLTQLVHHEKRSRSGYHLDHKYSITEGFKNKVPPKVIGSICNLEFIPCNINVSKGTKCSIDIKELYVLFTQVN